VFSRIEVIALITLIDAFLVYFREKNLALYSKNSLNLQTNGKSDQSSNNTHNKKYF
jgi:hypothetical protein